MAWRTRTTWINTQKPQAADFNNIGLDIRTWGDDPLVPVTVNANAAILSNLGELHGYLNIHKFFTNGLERIRIASDGKVGIGNAAPRAPLDILSGTANTAGDGVREFLVTGPDKDPPATPQAPIQVQTNDDFAAGKGGSIAFGARYITASTAAATFAAIKGAKQNATSGDLDGYLAFYTRLNAGNVGERMRITSTGIVAIGTISPDGAALLDLTSTSRGLLPPRMTTTQRDAITSPPAGLIVYNVTTGKINVRTASAWEAVTSA